MRTNYSTKRYETHSVHACVNTLVFSFVLIIAACAHTNVSNNTKEQRVTALFLEGRKAQTDDLHAAAIDFFTTAISIDDDQPGLYDARALSYAAIQDTKAASTDFTKAIMIDSRYQPAYVNRANLFMQEAQYSLAIQDYTNAIMLKPNNTHIWHIQHARGIAYAKIGNYKQAIADYTASIAFRPKYATAYYNRGIAYVRSNDSRAAIADMQQFLRLAENNSPQVLQARTIIFQLGGKPEK